MKGFEGAAPILGPCGAWPGSARARRSGPARELQLGARPARRELLKVASSEASEATRPGGLIGEHFPTVNVEGWIGDPGPEFLGELERADGGGDDAEQRASP